MEKLGTHKNGAYFPFTGWKDMGHDWYHYYVYDSHFGTIAPSLLKGRFTGYREGVIASVTFPKDFNNVADAKKHVEALAIQAAGA